MRLSSGTSGTFCPNLRQLKEFNGMVIYKNHSYADAKRLSIQSLNAIFDRLPTVSTARTITLGQVNKLKLTPEEIAVATQKGWTVA